MGRAGRDARAAPASAAGGWADRGGRCEPGSSERPVRPPRVTAAVRPTRAKETAGPGVGMTRLFIGAGRERGIRPQDLVGAIANEAGLNGRQIGAIEIADRFSLVEVPEASADAVVSALRGRTIKGKKTTVRRERFGAVKPGRRAS